MFKVEEMEDYNKILSKEYCSGKGSIKEHFYCVGCGQCFVEECEDYFGNIIGCSKCGDIRKKIEAGELVGFGLAGATMNKEWTTDGGSAMTDKLAEQPVIHYTKLKNGTWGIASTKELKVGEFYTISKKDGSFSTEQVEKFYGMNLYGDKFIYTISTKYKKGGYAPQVAPEGYNKKGGYKAKIKHDKYAYAKMEQWLMLVWNNEELISEMKVGLKEGEAFVKLYENTPPPSGTNVLLKISNENYEPNYVIGDRWFGDITDITTLYEAYKYKAEAELNKNRTWICCRMGCEKFPARGQKIKGILGLSDKIKSISKYNKIFNAIVVSENLETDKVGHKCSQTSISGRRAFEEWKMQVRGKFLRPVPPTPEHGFVDSRLVKDDKDIELVIEEIRKTGYSPEMIAMPFIDCKFSSVITPDCVGFGLGHEGATQGDGAIEIPLEVGEADRDKLMGLFWDVEEMVCSDKKHCGKEYKRDSGDFAIQVLLKAGSCSCGAELIRKWPYVEALYEDVELMPTVVQLRSGPEAKVKEELVKIKYVKEIDSSLDLLEWAKVSKAIEEDIENISGEGFDRIAPVVWHPGGLITSHFAVHCKDNKIPYISAKEAPVEGSIVQLGAKSSTNLEALREGLVIGLKTPLEDLEKDDRRKAKRFLKNFLGALHIYAIADMSSEEAARFVGYSWAVGARIISALPMGEARHKPESRANLAAMFEKAGVKIDTSYTMSNRAFIYENAWKLSLEKAIEGLGISFEAFTQLKWSGGYGGPKWAICTKGLLEVFLGIREFLRSQNSENASHLLEKINEMVNLAHNNGWWLNKLLTKTDFDRAGELPHFFIHPELAFRVREERALLGTYQLKVMAYEYSEEINKEKLKSLGVMDYSGHSKSTTWNEKVKAIVASTYEEDDEPMIQPIAQKVLSKAEIEEMLDMEGEAIKAQFQDNIHIQIGCMVINREYGYSAGYGLGSAKLTSDSVSKIIAEVYGKGEKKISLTGNKDSHYVEIDIRKGKVKGEIGLRFRGDWVIVEDVNVWNRFEEILEWQKLAKAEEV